MIIIIDCNVLISAAISSGGACRAVLDEVIRSHEWYFSRDTFQEFTAVSKYPKLKKYRQKFDVIVSDMLEVAIEVETESGDPTLLPDPDDVMYLQSAFAADADILITGNKKHFPEDSYQGVRILSPREFLDLIPGNQS